MNEDAGKLDALKTLKRSLETVAEQVAWHDEQLDQHTQRSLNQWSSCEAEHEAKLKRLAECRGQLAEALSRSTAIAKDCDSELEQIAADLQRSLAIADRVAEQA